MPPLTEKGQRGEPRQYRHDGNQPLAKGRVGDYLRRQSALSDPSLTLRAAATRLHREGLEGLVVTDATGRARGLFTLRDLRRCVAEGWSLEKSTLETLNGPVPVSINADADAFDALLLMSRHSTDQVVVTDVSGRAVGMVGERDIRPFMGVGLVGLGQSLASAADLPTLMGLRREVSRAMELLMLHGANPAQRLQMLTTLNDMTVRRVIELNQAAVPEDLEIAWLAFGSEGRGEQTLLTDQDNGLFFEGPAGERAESMRRRLLPFARQVNQDMARCGFTLCSGDFMAGNPWLCLSGDEWTARFDDFIDNAAPRNLVYASILLDWRPVHGAVDRAAERFASIVGRLRKQDLFLKQLAANAVDRRPPLGLFNRFRYAPDREERLIDLKRQGLAPFVQALRVMALAHGITQSNTLTRLRRLVEMGAVDAASGQAWAEAYNLIQGLRLAVHQECLASGQPLTNYRDPSRLNPLDRRLLKDAFKEGRRVQERLEQMFQL